MYADRLITPRPEIIEAGATPEALLRSMRLQTIQAAYESSEGTYEDSVEAAYATADLVRQTLRFEIHSPLHPALSPEVVTQTQRTNCHGHSIVASECLDAVGVDHWIGFANQHSFILLEDEPTGKVNLIDTAVKQLYTDVTPAIGGPSLHAQQLEDERLVNRLRGDIVLQRSHFSDKTRALAERPWMSFTVGKDTWFKTDDEIRRADTLVLRSYTPEEGRGVLESYANFTHAIERRDFAAAHERLQGLDGTYPDIDRRNRLKAPTKLIRALAHTGEVAGALDDIGIIERSVRPSEDLLLRMWPIDQRRRLGIVAGRAELINDSIEQYEAVLEQRQAQKRSTAAIRSRITKAKEQKKVVS